MTTQNLPSYIEPIKLAHQRVSLQGQMPLAEMTTLASELANTTGNITAQLDFGIDPEGFCFIKGNLETELTLRCQRCMKTFTLPLNIKISLSPIKNEAAAKNLPSHYEPLTMSEESVSVKTILEEELLLSLPLVAKHDPKDCPVKTQKISLTGEEPSTTEQKNPFDVLKKLR